MEVLQFIKQHLEIVNFLADFTDTPNAKANYGVTPIYCAAYWGHLEIVKFLASLTENPNSPDNYGRTPSFWAKEQNHFEIEKFLEGNK